MSTNSQKNSFVTIAEQISLLNLNATEILTSLNDVVTGQDSSVNITQLDEEGNDITYSLPTVGKLQADISAANENIKRLAGMNDNNVHIIDGKSTKKIYLSDLNREPNKIDNLNVVDTFRSTNNWFFESLMNPTLSTVFDVTDKIGNDVDGVVSRRYIVEFEKDENNELGIQGRRFWPRPRYGVGGRQRHDPRRVHDLVQVNRMCKPNRWKHKYRIYQA